MKIKILDVTAVNGERFVRFQTEVGQGGGVAKWMNEENPIVNYSYDVELDTDKTISEVLKNTYHQVPEHALTVNGNKVLMFGVLESIEDDGMAYLRLYPDSLVMIDVGDANFSAGENVVLEVDRSELEITAQGL
ncbi:TPA: hypothetical protein RQK43_003680 [Vibrio vulnificus]|uniref:hypothetical protein n=1 Tax=Vibrio vulnificus TaxID=672 RepID=UPI0019D449D5|nr:hypothetical protein [Vibrio vulnificus]ELY5144792.1 hypothetical protein [Vibrio vulnificus]MBN8146235.1 hypothetical protein [Vibrio vulnificus]MCA0779181.1 hypothetical protein [Vibrio vulnificus]MCU8316821.1 hypothetical protein [Vibrio vulnificus]NTJ40508.1 hypothetical protein [Vibrio vulnificus]